MTWLSCRLRRRWLELILGAIALALVFDCVLAPRGVQDLRVLRGHRLALEAHLRRLSAENTELGTKVQKLRSDDRYLERLVRNELGVARPDELVYRFAGDAVNRD